MGIAERNPAGSGKNNSAPRATQASNRAVTVAQPATFLAAAAISSLRGTDSSLSQASTRKHWRRRPMDVAVFGLAP